MKKMIGLVALCVLVSPCLGPRPSSRHAGTPIAATAAAIEASVAAAAAPVAAPAAQEFTVKGKVSVVNGPDGALKFIFINPEEGHGYKVDLVNGEGKTLADKHGKIVEAVWRGRQPAVYHQNDHRGGITPRFRRRLAPMKSNRQPPLPVFACRSHRHS